MEVFHCVFVFVIRMVKANSSFFKKIDKKFVSLKHLTRLFYIFNIASVPTSNDSAVIIFIMKLLYRR